MGVAVVTGAALGGNRPPGLVTPGRGPRGRYLTTIRLQARPISPFEMRPSAGNRRHTCVSLLLDAGTPPHVVREIVGHSAIDVTMTIYAHASLDEKRTAMRLLGEKLA